MHSGAKKIDFRLQGLEEDIKFLREDLQAGKFYREDCLLAYKKLYDAVNKVKDAMEELCSVADELEEAEHEHLAKTTWLGWMESMGC